MKEEFKIIEVNRIRNGYIIDTLTSVDIEEVVKTGGDVIQLYEGVIHRRNFKISTFRKVKGNCLLQDKNIKTRVII